jgi:cytochrome c553
VTFLPLLGHQPRALAQSVAGRSILAAPSTRQIFITPMFSFSRSISFLFVLLWVTRVAGAPVAPTFEDSMAQRVLACTGCHGKQGRAGPDGYYPRLAGKPVGYLYNQLRNFQTGKRHYGLMVNLLDTLSDANLREIAEHFSALDVPYVSSLPTASTVPQQVRGRELATLGDANRDLPACAQCHGEALMGFAPFVPSLLGLPRDYLNAQLGAWRTGERRSSAPDCMALVAQRLSADDVSAVVGWLAAQPIPNRTKPAVSLPKPMPLECGATLITRSGVAGAKP